MLHCTWNDILRTLTLTLILFIGQTWIEPALNAWYKPSEVMSGLSESFRVYSFFLIGCCSSRLSSSVKQGRFRSAVMSGPSVSHQCCQQFHQSHTHTHTVTWLQPWFQHQHTTGLLLPRTHTHTHAHSPSPWELSFNQGEVCCLIKGGFFFSN